jgi:hypothetical protein
MDKKTFFSTFFPFFSLDLVPVQTTKIGQNLSFSLDLVPVLNKKSSKISFLRGWIFVNYFFL